MLTETLGAEFQEASFDLLPADDVAASVLQGSALEQCFQYCLEAGRKMGRDFEAPRKLKRLMIEAGFENVVETQILAPVNSWPLDPKDKMIGNWVCLNGLRAAESLGKVMIVGGLREEDAPALIQNIRYDLTNANMRVYEPREYLSIHKLADEISILTVTCRICRLWTKTNGCSKAAATYATLIHQLLKI